MQKFDQMTGVAAPLDILNIDTDMIIPKQFLKTIKRSGLGKNLFDENALKMTHLISIGSITFLANFYSVKICSNFVQF